MATPELFVVIENTAQGQDMAFTAAMVNRHGLIPGARRIPGAWRAPASGSSIPRVGIRHPVGGRDPDQIRVAQSGILPRTPDGARPDGLLDAKLAARVSAG